MPFLVSPAPTFVKCVFCEMCHSSKWQATEWAASPTPQNCCFSSSSSSPRPSVTVPCSSFPHHAPIVASPCPLAGLCGEREEGESNSACHQFWNQTDAGGWAALWLLGGERKKSSSACHLSFGVFQQAGEGCSEWCWLLTINVLEWSCQKLY